MKRPTGKTACRNSFYLNIYRKAWDTEHEIMYRMLQEGTETQLKIIIELRDTMKVNK